MQNELIQRHGEKQTYLVKRVKVKDGGLTRFVSRKRVPATMLEFPWIFPPVGDDDIESLALKIETAARYQLASWQTLSSELGFDAALERELMDGVGGRAVHTYTHQLKDLWR